jgi:predicted nucleic acid-binding protein
VVARTGYVKDVFLDASGLVALVHERDALHEQADRVLKALGVSRTPLVVSDWVLAEFLSGASARALRGRSIEFVDELMASVDVTVVPAGREGFLEALGLYRSRRDKAWSLVDCSSMLICKARGIKRVFTHDRHFAQAGFTAMLR